MCVGQIPQFLLDECSRNGDPCRIFCTQPRRLAAIAVAERVAAERGESVGQTVGYHIRLESRYVRPEAVLLILYPGRRRTSSLQGRSYRADSKGLQEGVHHQTIQGGTHSSHRQRYVDTLNRSY